MVSGRIALAWTDQRHMDGDVIGVAQSFLQAGVFDPGFLGIETMLVTQVFDLLDGLHELRVLKYRVIAKNIHIEANALLDDRLTDAAGTDHGDGLAGNLIAKKRQEG